MKFEKNDLDAVMKADRRATLREAHSWRLGENDILNLLKAHYPRDYYEVYMFSFVRAVEEAVSRRIAQKIKEAPAVGMMDSYHVLRRKTVLDVLNEKFITDEEDHDDGN